MLIMRGWIGGDEGNMHSMISMDSEDSVRIVVRNLEILFLLHDIERSSDNFFMDICDIEPDQSERHEDNPDHESIEDHHDADIRESEV